MAVDHNNPQSRDEEILIATIDGNEYNKAPQSRMEELLLELKETIEEGGGGGGTSDYENLSNQPQINGETLIGNKTGADLGLVDAIEGKGLSTNDYDDNEKAAVAAATSAISAMKDGTDLDSFGDVEVALLDKADTSDLGTAAAKNSTNAVTSGSTDLVESGAVKDAIDVAVAAAYHHAGTKTVAQLTHDLLIAANEGNVYNITDSGTTTSDFIEGIGKTIDEGSNVGICKVGNAYMFDLLSGFVDTTNFVQKSQTAGLLKNDGTVNDEIEDDVSTLKSGLTDLSDHVDGSATTYPYADVITIEDAVPANLADCSVKVEPVQDLHGYDKPWVGGAGKNKLDISTITLAVEKGFTASKDDSTGLITIAGTYTGTAAGYGFFLFTTTYIPDTKVVMIDESVSMQGNSLYWDGTTGRVVCNLYNLVQGQSYNFTFKLMIVDNSLTPTSYEPYSNICPISGHTEAVVSRNSKNLCEKTIRGYIDATNNKISINNDGETAIFYALKGKTYTLSASAKDRRTIAHISSDNVVDNMPLIEYTTVPTGVYTWTATWEGWTAWYFLSDASSEAENTIQIEFGETATPYEPYKGQTYTLALGDTIYGGTVDFDTGVMTVNRASDEYDGSSDENWERYSIGSAGAYAMQIANTALNNRSIPSSNMLVGIPENATWGDYDGFISILSGQNPGQHKFITGIKSITTVEDWKTYLSSHVLRVCYELATPFTVQLTPQQIQLLQGTNTLYASTGDISVTVNGVSGSIGSVQSEVNELADDVEELSEGLTKLHYHKIAESAATGTRADKLSSLYATYNTLLNDVRKSAILLRNNADIFHAVNNGGTFSNVYVDINTVLLMCATLNPGSYIYNNNGTTTDGSSAENSEVFSLWIIE